MLKKHTESLILEVLSLIINVTQGERSPSFYTHLHEYVVPYWRVSEHLFWPCCFFSNEAFGGNPSSVHSTRRFCLFTRENGLA